MPSLPLESPTAAAGGNRRRTPWWRLVRAMGIARLGWSACALSIGVLGGAALLVNQSERQEVSNALDASVSLNAKGYARFVSLNLAIVDRQLAALRELHLQGQRLPTTTILDSRLQELNGLVLQIAVANAEGQITDSSLGLPDPPVNIGDRAHFRAVRDSPEDRMFISQTVMGRVSKKQSLQLLRPIRAPGGKFLGVVVASIDPELFKSYFTDMNALDKQGRLAIIGLDGIVRFRLTRDGFSAGQDVRATPQWTQLGTLPAGLYEDTSFVDGIKRRSGFHRVEGYPLVVTVATGLQAQLQGFNARWRLVWSLVLLLAVVLAVVTATIARLAKEQKRSLGLLELNRRRALESNRTKSNFLSSVSHELRTPLNSILGFSELIRDTGPDPQSRQYAGLIHKSGTHLHALVNTILDLTKIESGNMGLTLERVELPQLLDTLVAIHKVNADEKNVELSLSVDEPLQGAVESDRTKLVQVLNNVIHNAIKFTPTGAIFVVVKPAGDAGLLVSVIDTGIGIPAADIGQVFERFNTMAAPIDGAGDKGSGLGLALSRQLLNLMGGTIGLTSEVGQGTTVDIFIPYKLAKE